jgi:hypothetical protein
MGTDKQTDRQTEGQTNGQTDKQTNIYSVFRDKLSLPEGSLDCKSCRWNETHIMSPSNFLRLMSSRANQALLQRRVLVLPLLPLFPVCLRVSSVDWLAVKKKYWQWRICILPIGVWGAAKISGHRFFGWVSMSSCLLCFQSVFVLSIWCQDCWFASYYIFIHFYHNEALPIATTVELIKNKLGVGGAVPCPLHWLYDVEPVLALVLHGWIKICSCLRAYLSICAGWKDVCVPSHFSCLGITHGKVAVLNHLVEFQVPCRIFLRSDVNFLQLPRLLSQFSSIDHEKIISSLSRPDNRTGKLYFIYRSILFLN